jgi:hypothetical protein
MKILKAGTKVSTLIGDVEAIIIGVCITMDTVEYRIRWFYNGEEKSAWVYRHEIDVSQPKMSVGFNAKPKPLINENEITLITDGM